MSTQAIIESVLKVPFSKELTYDEKIEIIMLALRKVIESDKNEFHLLQTQIGLCQFANYHKKDLFEHTLFKTHNNQSDTTLLKADVVPEKFKTFMQSKNNKVLMENLINCYEQNEKIYYSEKLSKLVFKIQFLSVLARTLFLVFLYLILSIAFAVPLMPLAQTIGIINFLSPLYDHQYLARELSKNYSFSPQDLIVLTILLTVSTFVFTTLYITFASHPLFSYSIYIFVTAFSHFRFNNNKFKDIHQENMRDLRIKLTTKKTITSTALNNFFQKNKLSSESFTDGKKTSENLQQADDLSLFSQNTSYNKRAPNNQKNEIMESILSSEYIKAR